MSECDLNVTQWGGDGSASITSNTRSRRDYSDYSDYSGDPRWYKDTPMSALCRASGELIRADTVTNAGRHVTQRDWRTVAVYRGVGV